MSQQGHTVIEVSESQHGPNGWVAAILGGLLAAAMVVLALAIWQMSVGLSIGLAAAGIGIGLQRAFYGLSALTYNTLRGKAELERARRLEGYTVHQLPPGDGRWDAGQGW